MKAVISDSTVLIGLAKIEELHLLRELFREIYIPEAVFGEVVLGGNRRAGAEAVGAASWIRRKSDPAG